MEEHSKRVCGARNKAGGPCQKPPLKGRERCRLHGGKTPAKQNAGQSNGNHRHGLYSNALTDAEAAVWDSIPLGDVDAEIKLLKVKIARAMTLESQIALDPNSTKNMIGFTLSEIRRSSGDNGSNTDAVSKRPDTSGVMNWAFGRLAQLEKVRLEMLAAAKESGDGIGDTARDLIEAMRLMTQVENDR